MYIPLHDWYTCTLLVLEQCLDYICSNSIFHLLYILEALCCCLSAICSLKEDIKQENAYQSQFHPHPLPTDLAKNVLYFFVFSVEEMYMDISSRELLIFSKYFQCCECP